MPLPVSVTGVFRAGLAFVIGAALAWLMPLSLGVSGVIAVGLLAPLAFLGSAVATPASQGLLVGLRAALCLALAVTSADYPQAVVGFQPLFPDTDGLLWRGSVAVALTALYLFTDRRLRRRTQAGDSEPGGLWPALAFAAGGLALLGIATENAAFYGLAAMVDLAGLLTVPAPSPLEAARSPVEEPASPTASPDPRYDDENPVVVASMAQVKPLTLEFGVDLMPLVEPDLGGTLFDRVTPLRLSLVTETGFILPGVQIHDNPKLPPNSYQILVRGNVVARGAVVPDHELALLEGVTDGSSLEGFAVTDPVTGRLAAWVQGDAIQAARAQGCTVLPADRALMRHLESVVRGYAWELLRIEDVDLMLNQLAVQAPALVRLLGTTTLTVLDVHAVLVRLLREHVPIRDMELIVEALVERSRTTTETVRLVEAARGRLTRALCAAIADAHQLIRVLHMDDRLDVLITSATPLRDEDGASEPPDWQPDLIASLMEAVNEAGAERPVAILCSRAARPLVRPLLGATLPELAVLAPHEIAPGFTVVEVGVVHVPTEVTLDWVDPPPEGF